MLDVVHAKPRRPREHWNRENPNSTNHKHEKEEVVDRARFELAASTMPR